jgi:hypothetical protein
VYQLKELRIWVGRHGYCECATVDLVSTVYESVQ